jgi:hypothetical protein
MHVEVEGTRLWFDVEGTKLVPDGGEMRERPTVVLLHGGPGSFDHSYLKPDFVRLAEVAQVVYLDLPGHGRSDWGDPTEWSFELCADAVRAFCDALEITAPVVYGHSLGGFVVLVYALRHPGHARALVLQSTYDRFDLGRIVEEFRRRGGDEVAATVERVYGGDSLSVTPEEWAPCWRLFGPWVLGEEERSRTIVNRELKRAGSGADARLRRARPAGARGLPDARLRRRARPDHSGGCGSRDRRCSPKREAGNPRRSRTLSLEGRPGSLLAAAGRFRRWLGSAAMCRNIHTLFNFEPEATDEEIRGAALQYVRKISGFTKPSQANAQAFERAVDEVAAASRRLLDSLVTTAAPKDRAVEAERARARAAERYAAA